MADPVQSAVLEALPAPLLPDSTSSAFDFDALRVDLEDVAQEALAARAEGIPFYLAVTDEEFPLLSRFHAALRDSLFVELPQDVQDWVRELPNQCAQRDELSASSESPSLEQLLLGHALAGRDAYSSEPASLQSALAELLLFESVRLRLLIAAWSSDEFESLGGEEHDIDAIAGAEVETLLHRPEMVDPEVRPMLVMLASASVELHRDAERRAEALRLVGESERETLRMRARLRAAIRELRLTESVLLENALAQLLGTDRVELVELQRDRPLALEGMSRQAMDQRVSRSRRALAGDRKKWPDRRSPALFDLFRARRQETHADRARASS